MNPFFQLTAREKAIEMLRWCLVLPAARVGDWLGYAIGGTVGLLAVRVGWINPPSDDSAFNRSVRYLIWMFPEGVACVIAGAMMAPRWRRGTAICVAALWILLVNRIHGFEGPTLLATALAGTCGVAYMFYSQSKQDRTPWGRSGGTVS